jgi:hypothetical protein
MSLTPSVPLALLERGTPPVERLELLGSALMQTATEVRFLALGLDPLVDDDSDNVVQGLQGCLYAVASRLECFWNAATTAQMDARAEMLT